MPSSPGALDRYRSLAEITGDAVCRADADGIVVWASATLSDALGWSPEAVVGRPLADLVHPLDRESAATRLEACGEPEVAGPGRPTDPLRLCRADGTSAWFTVSLTPVRDDHGRPVGSAAVLHDVDALVRARLAAVEEQARVQAILSAQFDPLVALRAVRDEHGAIVDFVFEDANEPAAAFHGRTVETLVGSSVLGVMGVAVGGGDVAAAREVLTLRVAKVWNDEWSRVREGQGAGPTWLDLRFVPVDDDRVSVSWRDVTDRYLAQRRLVESEQRFRLLAEESSDVVFLAGTDGRITWVSPTVTRALGWVPEELAGQEATFLVHPEDVAALEPRPAADEPIDAGDGPRAFVARGRVARIRSRSGEFRWMVVSGDVLAGPDGEVLGVSGAMRDVHDLVLVQEQVARSHDLLRAVIDAQTDPHTILRAVRDETGGIVDFEIQDANQAAADFEGLPRHELMGRTIRSVYPNPVEAEEDVADCRHALVTGEPVARNDARAAGYVDDRGRTVYVDSRFVKVDEDRVYFTWRDVTDRHEAATRLAESEARFRLLAENMSDVILLVRDGVVAWVSPSATRALGWEPEELIGSDPYAIVHEEDVAGLVAAWPATDAGSLERRRYRVRSRDGRYHWVESEAAVVPRPEDGIHSVVLSSRIVDAEVAALAELEARARHDDLTGLVNRHEMFEQLGRVLGGAVRSGTRVGIAFCDLDGFKAVNDVHGHTAGDALLSAIARRLEGAVRSGDVVARVGGDELIVVLNGVHDLDDAMLIADKLRVRIAEPTPVPGGIVTVSASIGVTLAQPGETVDSILARADTAMYEAKRQGKNIVVAFGASDA